MNLPANAVTKKSQGPRAPDPGQVLTGYGLFFPRKPLFISSIMGLFTTVFTKAVAVLGFMGLVFRSTPPTMLFLNPIIIPFCHALMLLKKSIEFQVWRDPCFLVT